MKGSKMQNEYEAIDDDKRIRASYKCLDRRRFLISQPEIGGNENGENGGQQAPMLSNGTEMN
jgi:hypothetical protein